MPVEYHIDENGQPFTVIESYILFYAGDKIKIAKLKWLPKVEEPHWLKEKKRYIRKNRKDIRVGIRQRRKISEEKKEKKRQRTALSKVGKATSGAKALAFTDVKSKAEKGVERGKSQKKRLKVEVE